MAWAATAASPRRATGAREWGPDEMGQNTSVACQASSPLPDRGHLPPGGASPRLRALRRAEHGGGAGPTPPGVYHSGGCRHRRVLALPLTRPVAAYETGVANGPAIFKAAEAYAVWLGGQHGVFCLSPQKGICRGIGKRRTKPTKILLT